MRVLLLFVTKVLSPLRLRAGALLFLLLLALNGPAYAGGTVTNCTLAQFKTAITGGGLVTLACSGTITLTNTTLVETNTVIVSSGAPATLSMSTNALFRIFEVAPGVSLTLSNVVLANGFGSSTGGAILNFGSLQITNCLFTNNVAFGAPGRDGSDGDSHANEGDNGGDGRTGTSASGGAIFNTGSLVAFQTVFQFNTAAGGNGGSGGSGGNGSSSGGDGGDGSNGGVALGGAVYNLANSSAILRDCSFIDNQVGGGSGGAGGLGGTGFYSGFLGHGGAGAQGNGAAIYNLGNLDIQGCTFRINAALGGHSADGGTDPGNTRGKDGADGPDGRGGAINNVSILKALNCTFVNNDAVGGNGGDGGPSSISGGDGGAGGGGRGGSLYSSGTTSITNCTFSGGQVLGGTNGAAGVSPFPGSAGSAGVRVGGNIARASGLFVLKNTILAAPVTGKNANGTITDAGYNITSDNTPNFTQTGSRENLNPQLGTVGNNGGFTQTINLRSNSPAIDKGALDFCPATDQRGVDRPVGAHCDIGAFEATGLLSILTSPQNVFVTSGGTARFEVTVEGDAPLFQWRFNGTNITNATASSLTITNVQATNEGNYDVVVRNDFGSVTSQVARLTGFTIRYSPPTAFLSFLTQTGRTYSLEFTPTLAPPAWMPLQTQPGTGGTVTITHTDVTTDIQFYRLGVQ